MSNLERRLTVGVAGAAGVLLLPSVAEAQSAGIFEPMFLGMLLLPFIWLATLVYVLSRRTSLVGKVVLASVLPLGAIFTGLAVSQAYKVYRTAILLFVPMVMIVPTLLCVLVARSVAFRRAFRAKSRKFACPCCGYLTLAARASLELCPVCYWQDDGQDDVDADVVRGGPNGALSLAQARENYRRVRACDGSFAASVRRPDPEEMPRF